jgi:hypothetical protein
MRTVSEIKRLLPVLRAELIAQQFKAEAGQWHIEDAAACLDEAEGFLEAALSDIKKTEMTEPAE